MENLASSSPFQYDLSDIYNSEDIFAPLIPKVDLAKYMEHIDQQLDEPADDIGGLDSALTY